MPTIEINKKELEHYLGRAVDDKRLQESISYLGTDLEGIEDGVIKVEIFPHRPDLLSVPGFARALSQFMSISKKPKEYKSKSSSYVVNVEKLVNSVRPYTTCAVIKNVKFDDQKIKEIVQIQEKLHITFGRQRKKCAIGVYPLEAIKFPITYTAKDPKQIEFVPLESRKKMNASQMLSQTSSGRMYGHLLEGCKTYPVFLDANNEVLSVPPIINSHTVGKISDKTTDVFVECSGFDYITLSQCLNMIVCALSDMDGDVYEVKVHYPNSVKKNPELKPKKMKIPFDLVNKRLGLSLSKQDVKKALLRMGITTEKDTALIPPYRTDFISYADIIESVAIGYGYQNFEGTIPDVATVGKEAPLDVFKRRLSDVLIGLGLVQVSTFHLVSKDQVEGDGVWTVDAKTSEHDTLRNQLIDPVLSTFGINRGHEYPQRIFENGIVFLQKGKEVIEQERLCCGISGADTDYTQIRQIMDMIGKRLGLTVQYKESKDPFFIEGRSAQILIGNTAIGRIGEVSPKYLAVYKLEVPVAIMEINLDELFLKVD
ncbi:phenylalanine--tRNA ligase subunit beta [archaeon]|nr:phenylalanine--tRNA ligase subunit beta [archaeon]|tara:strand:+ start:870 stop:2492 length:1623 start_codon:yes stop_codon:yes gene_type:complete